MSATPGKTKHFQTIRLSPDVLLCDCPGLVFPQFAATQADLVCDGVLPIDQLREHTGPVSLVVNRIPQDVLEGTYGLRITTQSVDDGGTGEPTAVEFLTSYASEWPSKADIIEHGPDNAGLQSDEGSSPVAWETPTCLAPPETS